MSDWISAFVFFFAVIDPVGTLPVFIAVTAVHSEKRRIAIIEEVEIIEGGHETVILPPAVPPIASPGANIVSGVMGLILASVATSNVPLGLQQYFAVQRSLPVPALPLNASLAAAITRDGGMAAFFTDERKVRLA